MGVKLYADKGRLRLEWFFQSRKYYLYLGMEDTKSNRRKIAHSELLLELEADLENGEIDTSLKKYKAFFKGEPPPRITVAELYLQWIGEKSKGLTKKTVKKYEGNLKEITKFFPSLPVDALTLNHCRDFWEWIQKSGNNATTQNRKLANLQSCWDWGRQQEIIKSENPWRKIDKISLLYPTRCKKD